MKKVLAILLSVLMIALTLPTVFASSDYDRAKVAANDEATINALSEEQIAGVVLDWVDRQIEAATADFQQFNEYADITGMTVPSDLDGIIAYKDHVAELGGDFANLDMSALKTVFDDLHILDVALVQKDLADSRLYSGSGDSHGVVFCRISVAYSGEQIGNRICNMHCFFLLTSLLSLRRGSDLHRRAP